jgi:hypothetical protein
MEESRRMKIFIVTTLKTTATEPYTQLPRDRIELRVTNGGLVFLPSNAKLQQKYPAFWNMLRRLEIRLGADPAQVDAALLAVLRDKVGIRIDTDDKTQAAALLNLDEEDLIFQH